MVTLAAHIHEKCIELILSAFRLLILTNSSFCRWQRTYGIIAKKLVDMVGIPMAEMDVDYEEYCILKAMSLFQFGM